MTLPINNIAFILFNIAMASYHSYLIRKHKKISHGLWGALYGLSLLPFGLLFNWWYIPMGIFLRGWLFSPMLNSLRKQPTVPLDYWSLTSTSIIDKVERFLFRRFWIARAVYFALWITTIILEAKKIIIWKT